MSLDVSMKTAASGLIAAQAGLRATSDNIANVNTPGYVRKAIDQVPLVGAGMGMGVSVSGIKRITDQYLQLATLSASSESSRWDAVNQYLDNAQSLFGDPAGKNYFFSRLDEIFSAFSASASDPSSSLLRGQAISDVEDFLAEGNRINSQIAELGKTVDSQINSDVIRVNDLLEQINNLNSDISRASLGNADSSGSANIQSQLIDELSTKLNIQVAAKPGGGVTIRSTEGYVLAGEGQAARLSFNRTDRTPGYLAIEPSVPGVGQPRPIQLSGGSIRGLMDLRDQDLPGMSAQLGEFLSRASDQINAAHNASAAYPPPGTLTGRNTGLDLPTAVGGFTGTSTLAVLNSSGVVQHKVAVDFTAGTMSVNGGAGVAFTAANFLTSLNTALGANATASFTNGALSIAATGTNGLAIDEGTSMKAGRAFSHFFGLNDMVRSTDITQYDTGLTSADNHGFTAGDTISFRISQPDGRPIRDVTVAVPAGTSMANLLTALNASGTGVGLYGQFSLDSKGALTFAGTAPLNARLDVTQDTTSRGAGGASISGLFGLGVVEKTTRAGALQVDSALSLNPMKLALAKLDLSVAATQPAVTAGDGRGARALAAAGDVNAAFAAAGELGAVTMTVSRYAAEFGGAIGRQAASAENRRSSANAVANEATARRQSTEGVNIDEELVRLTTYQQAFNASARMIQASKELFDVLTNMI